MTKDKVCCECIHFLMWNPEEFCLIKDCKVDPLDETPCENYKHGFLKCKECGSENLNKAGYLMQKRAGMCQRLHCKDCGHLFVVPLSDLNDTTGS